MIRHRRSYTALSLQTATREILIVDPAVDGAKVLLDGLRPGIEVFHLCAAGDPLVQIAACLDDRRGIAALHILSHGEPGAVLLAGRRVDADALADRPVELEVIADALAEDASVVLYGCSVASGTVGRRFVDRVEAELGVAVAASETAVGSAVLGGSWDLLGLGSAVETAFSPTARAGYAGLLVTSGRTGGIDTIVGTRADDILLSLDGNDSLADRDDDVVHGVSGADLILGLSGRPFARRRMVFIDRGVEDGETLRRGVKPGVEAVWLSADRPALAQIADRLADGPPVEHLYIVSHGRPGALCFSGGVVDGAALPEQAGSLSRVAAALAPGAALTLLACEVGKGRSGRAFVQAFGKAVDAAVSAPEGIVGSADHGGAWRIRGVGDLPFGSKALARFSGSLAAVYDGSAGDDTINGTAGDDTIDATTTDGTTPADSDNDVISGAAGNDTITAGSGNDSVVGGDGNDVITGGAGNDNMSGDAGTDLLYGGLGNDSVAGLAGNDTVYGDGGNDLLLGDGIGTNGNDVIYGGTGNDTVWGDHSGGTGDDTVFGEAGNDQISGDAGNDVLRGGADNDTLLGGTGNDTLSGGEGTDRLSGGAGDDVLNGGGAAENDTLIGGDGNDTFTGSASDHNLDTISDFAIGDTIVVTGSNLSALNGTAASGTIALGGGFELTLDGIDSADGYFASVFDGTDTTITLTTSVSGGGDTGGGGTSDLSVSDSNGDTTGGSRTVTNTGGSPASAAIVQGTGNNNNVVTATLPPSVQITSEGPSTAQSGTTASDTLINAIDVRDTPGESGSIGSAQGFLNTLSPTTPLDVRTIVPTVNAGITTDDPIVITGSANGTQIEAFVIDMRTITGKTLQVNNIEFVSVMGNATVTGGAGNNYAVGDDNAQFISLGAGDDTLYGGGGSDTVGSADGNDRLYGEAGTDLAIGGAGNDTLFGGTEADVAYGNLDADLIYGNQANDTLFGGQDNDIAFGGQNDDVAYGNLGDDVLYGNFGDDTLYGGQGNDVLIGGAGNDTLNGGQGADSLEGGAGSDVFAIGGSGGADTITDFDGAGGDRVQIAANANGTSIDTFSELVGAATDTSDGGVEFTLGSGNTVKLMGLTTAQLQSDWFTFA